MLRPLVLVAVLGACSSTTTVVTVASTGTPTLITYRDGDGPWSTPRRNADRQYELFVHDDYEVWRVCTSPDGSVDLQGLRATVEDGVQQRLNPPGSLASNCLDPTVQPPPSVVVQGQMAQAGTVSIGGGGNSSTSAPGWPFSLGVPTGHRELIATDYNKGSTFAVTRMIRSDLDVAQDTNVGVVDLANGAALTSRSLSVAGLAEGATFGGIVQLYTALGNYVEMAVLPGGSQTLTVPRLPEPRASDDMSAQFNASSNNGTVSQSGITHEPSDVTVMVLLAPAPADLDPIDRSVRWRAIDDRHQFVALTLRSRPCAACSTVHRVRASQRWLSSHEDRVLRFTDDIPDFDPAWQPNFDEGASFSLSATIDDVDYSTSTIVSP